MKSGRYKQRRFEMRNMIKTLLAKKTLFALVLALTIFGAVYGFAATLNVGTQQLSAGNVGVASCQTSGSPTGTYTVAYDSSITGYKVSGVTVTGIDPLCVNKTVSVALTGAAGAIVGAQLSGTATAGGTLALTPGASPISAALVTGVSVAING
jgi:hypothetical protein